MSIPRALLFAAASACATEAHFDAANAAGSTPVDANTPTAEDAGFPRLFAAQRAADRAPDPARPGADGMPAVAVSATLGELGEAPAAIDAELARNAGHLQRCWEAHGEPVAGDIVIHAHIGPDGAVTGQCVTEDTVGVAAVQRCANDVIAMGRYPESFADTTDVVVSFHLAPRG